MTTSTRTYTDAGEFATYRHYYLRVNTEGSARLTIATFLTGLTFGIFVARLTTNALVDLTVPTVLAGVIDALLGAATFLFLLTAVSAYTATRLLAQLSPSATAALEQPTPVGLDRHDARRLDEAYRVYMEPVRFIQAGLGLLLLSLLLLAFLASPILGVVVSYILVFLLYRLPHTLDMTLDILLGPRGD